MDKISKKLDNSIDELASKAPFEIDDIVLDKAVEKAVEKEVNYSVHRTIERDIHKQVAGIVESEYNRIKDTVLAELVSESSKIDVARVRASVEEAAKKVALKKFDDNLDDILKDYKSNLESVTKIYQSFAEAATPSRERETILKIV